MAKYFEVHTVKTDFSVLSGAVGRALNASMKGSVAGVFAENLIAELHPELNQITQGKGHDYATPNGKLVESKTVTARGLKTGQSGSYGMGRTKPSREVFEGQCNSIDFAVSDSTKLISEGIFKYVFVPGTHVATLNSSMSYNKANEEYFSGKHEPVPITSW
jgi:hypothetical protein